MTLDGDDDFTRPGGGGADAAAVTYSPGTVGDWSPVPAFVAAALDELAANDRLSHVDFTSGSPATLFVVPLASGKLKSGVVEFAVYASDGTNHQSMRGKISWSSLNKAGTISSDVQVFTDTPSFADSDPAKTLSVVADALAGASQITLRLTPTTNLVAPAFHAVYFRRKDLGEVDASF